MVIDFPDLELWVVCRIIEGFRSIYEKFFGTVRVSKCIEGGAVSGEPRTEPLQLSCCQRREGEYDQQIWHST